MGADMAIEEINSQGGIKALGGARIVLREADAGDRVEKAVSAAQRVLTREKISAGIGSWLSSFTLGVTEVAERLQVPWLSLSYADSITERGFKYTFQTSPVSSLPARPGDRPGQEEQPADPEGGHRRRQHRGLDVLLQALAREAPGRQGDRAGRGRRVDAAARRRDRDRAEASLHSARHRVLRRHQLPRLDPGAAEGQG